MFTPFDEDFNPTKDISNIFFPETRELIKESIYCFNNGMYRSSLTTLYTTLLFDLIKKVEYLHEVENENAAKNTLDEIKNIRTDKPNSPEWENELIKHCHRELKLLSSTEHSNVNSIKNLRNQAAHPVISIEEGDYYIKLETITREQVLYCLAESFRAVFTKKPIIDSNIVKRFI